jgi:hypothetical protein
LIIVPRIFTNLPLFFSVLSFIIMIIFVECRAYRYGDPVRLRLVSGNSEW